MRGDFFPLLDSKEVGRKGNGELKQMSEREGLKRGGGKEKEEVFLCRDKLSAELTLPEARKRREKERKKERESKRGGKGNFPGRRKFSGPVFQHLHFPVHLSARTAGAILPGQDRRVVQSALQGDHNIYVTLCARMYC